MYNNSSLIVNTQQDFLIELLSFENLIEMAQIETFFKLMNWV